nr:MATE family efflux transporter [Blautia sp. TF12-12AT]
MKVTMTGMMVGCIVNIILDPLIIFGIGPFPRLGIEGAALATGIGQVTPVVIYWIIYKIRPISVKIRPEYLKEGKNLVGRLYAIGVPAILNLALPSLLISALNGILAVYSQSYVVVLGIYYKLQTFIYLTANGIVQGMRPIIGFNYGAGEHKRVRKIYEITLIMCAVIMLIGTGICLAIPEQLIGLFSSNPETIRLGGQALTRISVGFLISAVSITSSGALEGLGKGGSSLIISLCRNVIVILPAAYLLSHLGGGVFVWHASGSQRSFPQRFLLWYTAAQYEDKKYKKKRKAASCGRRLFFL